MAEEVEKVSPELVARGDDGKPYSVRYEAVNAMLQAAEIRKVDAQLIDLKPAFISSASNQ